MGPADGDLRVVFRGNDRRVGVDYATTWEAVARQEVRYSILENPKRSSSRKGKARIQTLEMWPGLDGAKEELEEIVAFLKAPEKYTNLGAKIPKGSAPCGPSRNG